MRNVLVVISGPSGVGKGTLVDLLLAEDDGLVESVSCTTRAPRTGECNGREYFFISEREFRDRIAAKDFWSTTNISVTFTVRPARLWSVSSGKSPSFWKSTWWGRSMPSG